MISFDIKRVQERLLKMAKEIASILEDHDIPYQIAFGTLLGAVRHKGFIPWDDDFDFFLFDDSYEKAMEVLQKNISQNMFLENEKTEAHFFHGWARIKDTQSDCQYDLYPQDKSYLHHGLCVDLFRIKKMHGKDFADFRFNEAMNYIKRRKKVGLISDEEFITRQKKFEECFEKDKTNSTKEILAYPFDIGKQYPEDVFPLKKYKFEDTTFFGPQNADNILAMRYGDYRKLPPESERHPHYSQVIFKENE